MKKNKNTETATAREEKPIDVLQEEPREVESLFAKFEQAERLAQKEEIVRSVNQDLRNHPAIEEEIFYPAAGELIRNEKEPDPVDGILEEYRAVDLLIQELEETHAAEAHSDAQFVMLSENVKHPGEEEGSKKKKTKRPARKKAAKPVEAFLEKAA